MTRPRQGPPNDAHRTQYVTPPSSSTASRPFSASALVVVEANRPLVGVVEVIHSSIAMANRVSHSLPHELNVYMPLDSGVNVYQYESPGEATPP